MFIPNRDAAIRAAQSLPELVENLRAVDPALAQQITGKTLIASKSPWGTFAVAAVAYLSSKYGLGWSEGVDELVAGGGILLGAYLMRLVTSAPIAGIFRRPPSA
jgi:hypothetical protein